MDFKIIWNVIEMHVNKIGGNVSLLYKIEPKLKYAD